MAARVTYRPFEILLVEDEPGDVRLAKEALKTGSVPMRLNVAIDGEDALKFLYQEGLYHGAPRPDLILLDLNLPKLDGREVLKRLKADSSLKRIPVVVLTTSEAERDVDRVYELQANCYITKPKDLDDFFTVVQLIESFWFSVAELPSR